MSIREENPVRGPLARVELGKPGPAMGVTRYTLMLRAMGKQGARFVLVSECRKWLQANPDPRAWPMGAPSNTRKRLSAASGRKPAKL